MTTKHFTIFLCLILNFHGNNGEVVLGENNLDQNGSYAARNFAVSHLAVSLHEVEPSKAEEFPSDIFDVNQLRHGAVILHFVGALYSFGIIGIVCGDYFLPSIDCICSDLNLSQDVAAATFMSFATTAPELFIILIATFITETDVGVSAVVGSGMFNILGVATIGGLAAIKPIKLDWWPLYRDSLVYMMTPIALSLVLADGNVTLIESLCLIVYYFFYFLIMVFNRRIRKKIKTYVKKIKKDKCKIKDDNPSEKASAIPTIKLSFDENNKKDNPPNDLNPAWESKAEIEEDGSFKAYFVNYEDSRSLRRVSACSTCSNKSNRSRKKSTRSVQSLKASDPNQLQVNENLNYIVPQLPDTVARKNPEEVVVETKAEEHVCDETEIVSFGIFSLPEGSFWDKTVWLIQWPANVILHYTIPDCRFKRWRKFYPITFVMCVFWIGGASYFGTWMISVMGDTFEVSDSVMGLTFLALGGSMPEAISTFIMARQGEGGLGFSNSLGGNTMDICLCLGLPWMVNCIISGPVEISSRGLQYNTAALVIGIIVLLTVATYTKFHMNKKMGVVCCTFYAIFIVVSILIELNIIDVDDSR